MKILFRIILVLIVLAAAAYLYALTIPAHQTHTRTTTLMQTPDAVFALLTDFPAPLESPVHVANCPMWDKSPANWLQAGEKVENPFMGTKMSGCGDMVKTLGAAK